MYRSLIAVLVAASLFTAVTTLGSPPSTKASVPSSTDKVLVSIQVFPKDDPWNTDISKDPVDPRSAQIIVEVGANKPLHPDWGTKYGIPFQLVSAQTPRVARHFDYPDESDKGPYPLPVNPLIEGTLSGGPDVQGDRHILCLDPSTHQLFELYHAIQKENQ